MPHEETLPVSLSRVVGGMDADTGRALCELVPLTSRTGSEERPRLLNEGFARPGRARLERSRGNPSTGDPMRGPGHFGRRLASPSRRSISGSSDPSLVFTSETAGWTMPSMLLCPSISGFDQSLVSTSGTAGWTMPCVLFCPNTSGIAGAALATTGRLCRTSSTTWSATADTAGFNCKD